MKKYKTTIMAFYEAFNYFVTLRAEATFSRYELVCEK